MTICIIIIQKGLFSKSKPQFKPIFEKENFKLELNKLFFALK